MYHNRSMMYHFFWTANISHNKSYISNFSKKTKKYNDFILCFVNSIGQQQRISSPLRITFFLFCIFQHFDTYPDIVHLEFVILHSSQYKLHHIVCCLVYIMIGIPASFPNPGWKRPW